MRGYCAEPLQYKRQPKIDPPFSIKSDQAAAIHEQGVSLDELHLIIGELSAAIRSVFEHQNHLEGIYKMAAAQDLRLANTPAQQRLESLPSPLPVAEPERFNGSAETCEFFLLKWSLFLADRPQATDMQKVAFIISRLRGQAGTWAISHWNTHAVS